MKEKEWTRNKNLHLSKNSKIGNSFEKVNNKTKQDMKETIAKSLKLLNKKRPYSAKIKNQNEKSEGENTSENFKRILKTLKSYKYKKVEKKNGDLNIQNLGKPPSGPRKRIKNRVSHDTLDSMSGRFSQISPIGNQDEGIQKYQDILK